MSLNFKLVHSSELEREASTRSSKYNDLREICRSLEVGQSIRVENDTDKDVDAFRINISNAVRVPTNEYFEAIGEAKRIRIVRVKGNAVAITCIVPKPKKEKKAKAETTTTEGGEAPASSILSIPKRRTKQQS